jgi:hypothetical protein
VQKDLDIAEYTDPIHNPMIRPARLGHLNARTQSGVAARPQGTLLSVRKNLRPNSGRTRLRAVSPPARSHDVG